MSELAGSSVVVVGGSRGLGLATALAARDAGATVTAVARDAAPLAGIDGLNSMPGEATDESFAAKVLADVRPDLLVITAGAVPPMRPLTGHTWETFSVNWHADVRIAFTWLRAALSTPLRPGSRVVVFGSAAELRGSPLSGGYAGAKAMVRLMTGYAAAEANGLGITMTTVLPVITPGTTIGKTAIDAYAMKAGQTSEQFRIGLTAAPTPESAGAAIVALATTPGSTWENAYMLDAGGLRPIAHAPA
ncbi:SDR family oxidoreductase [Actinoplanes sp. HUAS TT8]|uniref:SDR family oxidoreductase n=1 Tax=Actinoplanes sp. HUAS TT8 TaxID=3447453 RepID=UPI003F527D69